MSEKEEFFEYPTLTNFEFEKILQLYGMSKAEYCNLRGFSRSWFYNVLRNHRFVSRKDIDTLLNHLGKDTFTRFVGEVKRGRGKAHDDIKRFGS